MAAASEADLVLVADTGSTDDTVAKLRSLGATIESITVEPWRFDVARNAALDLVPPEYEILFALDLDEVVEEGWRAKVKAAWRGEINQLAYTEILSRRPDGSPGSVVPKRNIHNRDFRWHYPIHEALVPVEGKVAKVGHCPIVVEHCQDASKSRGSYLPLLQLATDEEPQDDRMAYYHARELYYAHKWAEALHEFLRHQGLKSATWAPERASSMQFAAECQTHLGHLTEAEALYLRACSENPHGRATWLALGRFYLGHDSFKGVYWAAHRALAIKRRQRAYVEEESAWREGPHDLLAVAAWYMDLKDEAREHVNIAIAWAPFDARIQKNHIMMEGVELEGQG